MIIHSFDDKTPAIIEPSKKENAPKLDVLIVNFSYIVERYVAIHYACCQIGETRAACGVSPIYEIDYNGRKIGYCRSIVGAAGTVGLIEDILSTVQTDKIILFGGAGCLNKDIARGKLMVPTAAYRDEGTSYHYAPAADYIDVKNHSMVAAFLAQAGLPYALGKTWTTDAIYRETQGNFEKRKADGCISVEMEVAAVQALCDFRGIALYNFLSSGDLLDAPKWDPRSEFSENGSQHDPRYFQIALDLAAYIA